MVVCDDVDERVRRLEAIGFEVVSGPRAERWLWREARLADPAGNTVCLSHAGANRNGPPWRVEAPLENR